MQRANGLMGGSCLQTWLWTGSALSSCSGEVIQSSGFLNPCKAAGFQAPTPHPSLNHPLSILLLCYFVFAIFCFLLCRICLCSDFLMNITLDHWVLTHQFPQAEGKKLYFYVLNGAGVQLAKHFRKNLVMVQLFLNFRLKGCLDDTCNIRHTKSLHALTRQRRFLWCDYWSYL